MKVTLINCVFMVLKFQELCAQLQALLVKLSLLEEMLTVHPVNFHLSIKKPSSTNVFH